MPKGSTWSALSLWPCQLGHPTPNSCEARGRHTECLKMIWHQNDLEKQMNKKYYQYFHHPKTSLTDSWCISFWGSLLCTDFFFFLPSYYHCIKKKKNVASNPREERKPDTGKAVLPNQLYHAEPRLDFKDDSHKICINLLRSTLTGPIWQNELKLLKSLSPVALD